MSEWNKLILGVLLDCRRVFYSLHVQLPQGHGLYDFIMFKFHVIVSESV